MTSKGRVAVVGAGVSGITAAHAWQECGYEVTLFEKRASSGGQWRQSYPGVTLQNVREQYQFPGFPSAPFFTTRHPTAEQLLEYFERAIEFYGLRIEFNAELTSMVEAKGGGWTLKFIDGRALDFSYVELAIGQYPGDAKQIPFEGLETFKGLVHTQIPSHPSHGLFKGERVVVIGNGKTALDFSCWCAESAASTTQVFRKPHWSTPEYMLNISYDRPFVARVGSDMMPSWCHDRARLLHVYFGFVVNAYWWFVATLFRFQHMLDAGLGFGWSRVSNTNFERVMPPKSQFVRDFRSATAIAPPGYMRKVAEGRIQAVRGQVSKFVENGVKLSDGHVLEADIVLVACGSSAPRADFLDAKRSALFQERGGINLYRHLVHPEFPNVGFAGYNHGFLHIALVYVGAIWKIAAFEGNLALPDPDAQKASWLRVQAYKEQNSNFEQTQNIGVSSRFQQHLDILCRDLGLNPARKWPLLETLQRYDPLDYSDIGREYLERAARGKKSTCLSNVDA